MLIEIGAPATLPLGLVKLEGESGSRNCLLGLTVQHPPVNLFAQASTRFSVVGPRADAGYEFAVRFLQSHQLKQQAEVEIELAIPNLVGLGSAAVLALSMAKALSWVHRLAPEQRDTMAYARALGLARRQALEVWGFDRGGLLLVETETGPGSTWPALLRRQEIAHKEKDAWAFVLFFPDVPDNIPGTLEQDRRAALLQAAPQLSSESGRLVEQELWPAVATDDFAAFGQALLTLQQLNESALRRSGTPVELSEEDQAILDLIQEHGAAAWGKNIMGLSFYGLVKGAKASIELRKKLRDHVGFFGGTVMATITDNKGAGEIIKDENLDENKMNPLRLNLPR